MKIVSTNDRMDVQVGGIAQLVMGFVFIVIGVALAGFVLSGPKDSNTGKPAPAWLSVIGIIFALAGIFVMFTAKKSFFSLQRGGDATIFVKRLIGGRSQHQSFPTASITAVELSTVTTMNNTQTQTAGGRESTISLILNNNDRIPVAHGSKGGSSVNGLNLGLLQKAPLSNEATQIAQFLNVPLQADGVGSLAQGIDTLVHDLKGDSSGSPAPSTPPFAGTVASSPSGVVVTPSEAPASSPPAPPPAQQPESTSTGPSGNQPAA